MGKFAKWIGGGLGFVLGGGPIGALVGFAIGAMFDNIETVKISSNRITQGDYVVCQLVLIAAMLKADGKILRTELDFVKKYLVQNYGYDGAQEALGVLKNILKQDIPVNDVCGQIADNVDYSSRLQLLHFMLGLAHADGRFETSEEQLIMIMAASLRIEQKDLDSIRSMFRNTTEDYYKILEIESSVTDEEVKKAYRKMAIKYHPDKVAYLGEEVRKTANEKIQKLNEAYEKIKKERGMV